MSTLSTRIPAASTPRIRPENIIFLIVALAIGILVLVPLIVLLLATISPGFESLAQELTLANYAKVYTNARYYDSLKNTLLLAATVTLAATLLGGSLAWLIGRTDVPTARVLEVLILVPLFISPFLGALGWALAVRPGIGIVGNLYQQFSGGERISLLSSWGIMWVLSLYMAPYAYTFIVSSLRSMDPALEQAASLVGLGVRQTARKITIPLVRPAVLSATLLIFISVAGQFGVPVLLGMPANFFVITTRIFTLIISYPTDWTQAATLSTMLLTITMVGVFLQVKALGKGLRRFATITGRGYRPGQIELGRLRYIAAAIAWLYVLVGVIVPIGTLIYASFLPEFSGSYSIFDVTLRNYVSTVIEEPRVRQSIINSVIYSGVAATIGVALTAVAAWIIYRSRVPGRRLLEYVCMVPLAIPHIVLAVAFLWSFIRTPIYGTMWILILAYVAAFIPFSIRTILPGLSQIDSSLEESGRMCGLSWFQIFSRIVVPLIRPTLIAAWLLLFMIFVKELPTSIMLYTNDTQVLSVSIYDFWTRGRFNGTAAIATTQIALVTLVVLLANWLTGRQGLTRGL